jgi:AmmeMemoRadiSam system protein A
LRRRLLGVAARSIRHGLAQGRALPVDPTAYAAPLRERRATFVTLETGGQLRGCIGALMAERPWVVDVAENAFSAAFRDPRFPPLAEAECHGLSLSISVLTPSEALVFDSEADLLRQLRPGVDGLILSEGIRRGTFLPSVWDQLPDPAQFLAHLKLKAGMAADYWSQGLRVERYTTEQFGATMDEIEASGV